MSDTREMYYSVCSYLDSLWRRRFMVAIFLVFMPVLGLLAGIFFPVNYEASTSLATFNSAPPFMKDFAYTPNIEEQFSGVKAYITSSSSLKKVALEAGLINAHSSEKKVESTVDELSKALTVRLIEKNVVQIKLLGKNPQKMASILNLLSSIFMTELLKPFSTSTQSTVVFLEKQLHLQEKKLNEAMDQLSRFEIENSNYLPKFGDIYDTELKQVIISLAQMQSQYKSTLAEKKWLVTSLARVSPEIENIEKEIAANEAELNKMRALYTEDYPGVKAALERSQALKNEKEQLYKQRTNEDSNLEALWNKEMASSSGGPVGSESLLDAQLKNFESIQQKLIGLTAQINDLTTQKANLSLVLQKVADTEKKMHVLKKTVAENQDLYEDLLKRYNIAKMTAQINYAGQDSPIKIVAPFIGTGKPLFVFPLIGVLAGIFLSLGFVLFFDLMDDRVRRKHRLEDLTGVPVISRVGELVIE